MKFALVAAAAIAALTVSLPAARASEIALKLDDGAQNAVLQLPVLLDSCVAGMTLRADAAVCRSISQFLGSLALEVKNTQAAVAKEAAAKAPPSPAPEPAAAEPTKP